MLIDCHVHPVRERLVGGTAERFVRSFWPDFDARARAKPR